jgi:hypothetical protein
MAPCSLSWSCQGDLDAGACEFQGHHPSPSEGSGLVQTSYYVPGMQVTMWRFV